MPSIVDKSSVRKVCVDDFALKKRFSYGTVMVDIETHRIIDIIPSRDKSEVKKWLDTFPNLMIVSRDGSSTYAAAIRDSHHNAIQVSDRFHIIKGLSEAVNKYIIRVLPARVEIPLTEVISEELQRLYNTANRTMRIQYAHKKRKEGLTVSDIALLLHSTPTTINRYLVIPEESLSDNQFIAREKQHQLAIEQKQHEVDEARRLVQEGYTIEKIALMMNHTYRTIQNYLNPDYSVVGGHYNVRIPGKLYAYEKDVIELRSKGMTYPQIHEIICKKGYDGSVASLRMFMQKERIRRQEQEEHAKKESAFVQRKSLCQLIYKKLEKVTTITEKQSQQVLLTYPLISELYTLIKDFYAVIFSTHAEKLDPWIKKAQGLDVPELKVFLEGLSKDLSAIKNGITYEYNNGLAEGSVNKIKVIKRIMYGRNSFELLKAKILFHEMFHVEFN